MSEYSIRNTGDSYEVVQLRPTVLGRFEDETYAKLFLNGLQGDMPAAQPSIEGDPESKVRKKQADRAGKSEPPSLGETEPSNTKVSNEEKWTEQELDAAYLRAMNGEKLTEIAEDFGKSFFALRAHWARNKKELLAERDHVEQSADVVSCEICDRDMKTPTDGINQCARCRRD